MLSDEVKDWVIVLSGGLTLIGKKRMNADALNSYTLSPVYALQVQVVQTGPNSANIVHGAQPIALLPSFDSLELARGAPEKMVSDLSSADQRKIMNAVHGASDLVQRIRAGDANITLAKG